MASRPAYPVGIPDSALAVVGCGLTVAIATAGGSRASGRPAAYDLVLGAAALGGAAGAAYYFGNMVLVQRRLCAYCLGAVAGFAHLARLAIPIAVRALRARR